MHLSLLLLLALAGPASAISWNAGDPLLQFRAVLAAADPADIPELPAAGPAAMPDETPVYCRPVVIAALTEAWSKVRRGRAEFEAVFRVDFADGEYTVTFGDMTYQTLKQSITIDRNRTVAVFHTHPDISVPEPADKDFNSPVPNFVLSRRGLMVTVIGTKNHRFVRRDWSRPCGP